MHEPTWLSAVEGRCPLTRTLSTAQPTPQHDGLHTTHWRLSHHSATALALVLTIFEQGVFGEGIETPLGVFKGLGNVWYLSTLVSPLAGKYYLDNAERTEQVSVKIITEDDEMSSEIIVQGDDEEIDRFQKTLDLREKGMVYVKGIFQDA